MTALEQSEGAAGQTMGGYPGGSRSNRSKQQIAFVNQLQQWGAKPEEIKKIEQTIATLVRKAEVRQQQEGTNDQLLLLQKVEIRLHELVELRKAFNHHD